MPTPNAAHTLVKHQVCFVSFKGRNIGYGVEEGEIEAFWTGEIDTWGKYTFRPVDGSDPFYLFADEILEVQS